MQDDEGPLDSSGTKAIWVIGAVVVAVLLAIAFF
jgi:hypothetical protein